MRNWIQGIVGPFIPIIAGILLVVVGISVIPIYRAVMEVRRDDARAEEWAESETVRMRMERTPHMAHADK